MPASVQEGSPDPVSNEKRYEFVTQQLRYTNDKIIEAFELFLKLTAAVLGAAAWVATQQLSIELRTGIGKLVPWLVTGIGAGCIALIVINLISWWGYRKAEAFLAGPGVPAPKFPRSASGEIVLSLLILSAVLAVWFYNPFAHLGPSTPVSSPNGQGTTPTPPSAAR